MDSSTLGDNWQLGDPYERYVGRWSRLLAPRFLDWLDPASGLRWLDVGCGTGALSAAILSRCTPAELHGIDPSEGFLSSARQRAGAHARWMQGDAAAIPLPDGRVDVIVSGLVLNFVPDPHAGLREMVRVGSPSALLAAYVWDYAGAMGMIRCFWDAAVELDPAAAPLDEGVRFPLCRAGALEQLFTDGGLGAVASSSIDIETSFASFDDYWQPFLGGQGPAPAYVTSLDDAARCRLRDTLRERLPRQPDGSIVLTARAWAVRGSKRQ